jgi:hypothetical protein
LKIPFVYTSGKVGTTDFGWHVDTIEHDVPEVTDAGTPDFDVAIPNERSNGVSTMLHKLHAGRIYAPLDIHWASPEAWLESRLHARAMRSDLPHPPVAGAWTLHRGREGKTIEPSRHAPTRGSQSSRDRFEAEAHTHAQELLLVDGALYSSACEPCVATFILRAQRDRAHLTARFQYRSVLDDWRTRNPDDFRIGSSVPPVVPLAALESWEVPIISDLTFLGRGGKGNPKATGSWTSRIPEADINCYETLRFVEDRFLGLPQSTPLDREILVLRTITSEMLAEYESMDGTIPDPVQTADVVRNWNDYFSREPTKAASVLKMHSKLPLAVTESFIRWWEARGVGLLAKADRTSPFADVEEAAEFAGFSL